MGANGDAGYLTSSSALDSPRVPATVNAENLPFGLAVALDATGCRRRVSEPANQDR